MRLSEAQAATLKHMTDGAVRPCDGNEARTCKALARLGLIEPRPGYSDYYDLTHAGEVKMKQLWKCSHCGFETHPHEAACIGCGKLKSWAHN